MGKVSSFDVLKTMSQRNLDIRGFKLDNMKSARTGKNGFGSITLAINNDTVIDLLTGKSLTGMLLVADYDQYKEVEKELQEASSDAPA